MPELPEVERGRKLAERTLAGKRLVEVHVTPDEIVYPDDPPEAVRAALRGASVEAALRRGKYIWLALDRRPWPLFHFGMTGAFRVPREAPLPLASSPRAGEGDEWPPRFTKILVVAEDGAELAMTNARRLGRIRLRDDPSGSPPVSRLGFDPLIDMPGPAGFSELLRGRRRAALKSLLLDQGFAAGVGNWIADETLYQAGIDPRRRAGDLSEEEAERLRTALHRIVTTAVSVDAEKDALPDDWLFHRRWGRNDDAVDADGRRVEFLTIAGRTTAWVPGRQG